MKLGVGVATIDAATLARLDDRLLIGKHVRLLPAAEYRSIPLEDLRVWCMRRGRYGLTTTELVQWLMTEVIKDDIRSTMEVGAGCGDLAFHLGIVATDSHIQLRPDIAAHYRAIGQVPVTPGVNVYGISANDAVKTMRPDIVIASWLTRRFLPGQDIPGKAQAFVYGADEEDIIGRARVYVHIGHERIHASKTALSLPHETYKPSWLVSRAADQSANVIYVWRRP